MRLSSLNSKKELGLTSERIFFGSLLAGDRPPRYGNEGPCRRRSPDRHPTSQTHHYGNEDTDQDLAILNYRAGQALAHARVRGGQAPALRYRVAVFFNRENRVNLANPVHVFSFIRAFAGDRPPRYGNEGTRVRGGQAPALRERRPTHYVPGAFKKFRIT